MFLSCHCRYGRSQFLGTLHPGVENGIYTPQGTYGEVTANCGKARGNVGGLSFIIQVIQIATNIVNAL